MRAANPGFFRRGRLFFLAAFLIPALPPRAGETFDSADKAAEVFLDGTKGAGGGGLALLLDFADQTWAHSDEPRLGGGTAGLGRHLRNVVAGECGRQGLRPVDLDATLAAVRRLGFTVADLDSPERVRRLLDEASGAEALIYGFITPAASPALLNVEMLIRRRSGRDLQLQSVLSTLVVDGDLAAARGLNLPPLSDNLPNVILPGHPLIARSAPHRLEVLGPDGVRELRIRNNRVYVAGEPGEAFSVRLTNHSGQPAAVALFVDTVPAFAPPGGRDAGEAILASAAGKLVLPAGGSETLSSLGGGRLRFGETADSDESGRDYWQAPGVICAAFYPVGDRDVRFIWDLDRSGGWVMRRLAADSEPAESRAAGADGGRVRHASVPAAVLNIHYDIPGRVDGYRSLGRRQP